MRSSGGGARERLIRWLGGRPDPEEQSRRAARRGGRRPVVGLTLSGGGARSSFQIGALLYLYDHERIAPTVITGTSAGSILAATLAQHSTPEGQRRALGALERIWSEMTSSSDMFTELDWSIRLREQLPTWQRLISLRARAANPLETIATLWEAGRSSTMISRILDGVRSERSAFRPGPVVDRLLDPEVFTASRVAASGITLRIAVVSLETGRLRYVDQNGRLRDEKDEPITQEGPVELVEAIRASCAIPAVFPPVRLDGGHYVDGGVRRTLPVEVAMSRLGASHCYAVVASPAGVPPEEGFAEKDLLQVVRRATSGIMSDEILQDDVSRAKDLGAVVIQPELDIHDLTTVDPGLIAIAIAYGWMRAADICERADARREAQTHEIIALRRRIWALEESVFRPEEAAARTSVAASGPAAPSDAETRLSGLDQIAELKRRLRTLLAAVSSERLPPGAEDWWRGWEQHAAPITEKPDWLADESARDATAPE